MHAHGHESYVPPSGHSSFGGQKINILGGSVRGGGLGPSWFTSTLSLGIPHQECLMVLSEFVILFFRRHGFRTITFERQDGSFQYFRQSQVMVKGRYMYCCVILECFPTKLDPQGGRSAPPIL